MKDFVRQFIFNGKINAKKLGVNLEAKQTLIEATKNCHGTLSERIYWILNDLTNYPLCSCGNKITKAYKNLEVGYASSYCGMSCALKSEKTRQKTKDTCNERYGGDNIRCSKEVNDKIKNTCIEKYGVGNPMQNKEVKNKTVQTHLDRYGGLPLQTSEGQLKFKQTCVDRYGVENPYQAEEKKQKIKQTVFANHGVECYLQLQDKKEEAIFKKYGVLTVMHIPEIADKCKISVKRDFTFPSGNVVKIQGYEHIAIQILLQSFDETDIIVQKTEIPAIYYFWNEKNRRYYPDIFVKSKNLIIEVKSEYTFNNDLQRNIEKRNACIRNNFNFEFWICDKNKIIEIKRES